GERAYQRLLVHHCAARRVDEKGGGLHQRKLALADHVPRFLVERRMERNEVGLAEQLVERHILEPCFLLLARRLAPRRAIEDPHGETARAARDRATDAAAAAHEPEHLAE